VEDGDLIAQICACYRDTEVKLLRGNLKEIEKETKIGGDQFTMKAKMKLQQDQLETAERRINSLRSEVFRGQNGLVCYASLPL